MKSLSTKILIITATFYQEISNALVKGAMAHLVKNNIPKKNIIEVKVPGSFEIPVLAAKAARSKKYAAIITLGAVIRGETPHFDYVCHGLVMGLSNIMVETETPIVFGVLTTNTYSQAEMRAGLVSDKNNKGTEAAQVALHMIETMEKI